MPCRAEQANAAASAQGAPRLIRGVSPMGLISSPDMYDGMSARVDPSVQGRTAGRTRHQPKHQGHFRVNTPWGGLMPGSLRAEHRTVLRAKRSMCRGTNLLRDPASRRGGSVLHVNDERIRACHLAEQSTAGTPRPRWDDTGDHASRNSSEGQTVSSLRYLSACYGFARRRVSG